nr:substrate-binding domain-containing protein [Desulfobulbaceae bacterium]
MMLLFFIETSNGEKISKPQIAYIVSDQNIPFWDIIWRGIRSRAEDLGYEAKVYSAENSAKAELQNLVKAIRDGVAGIIVSPTNSSACVTLLKLARNADIPVVIADIGTEEGEYVSYITSDNRDGAYQLGKLLARELKIHGWQNGQVGIIAIPQRRENGKQRTAGFIKAMNEEGIQDMKIKQQETFSHQETYNFTADMIETNPDLRAIWLQGSNRYQGALDAIHAAGKKNEILLVTFDAEPEFIELIPEGILVGAGMQQPFLIGEKAFDAMDNHLKGRPVTKTQQLPVLVISAKNIAEQLPMIRKKVFGLEGH